MGKEWTQEGRAKNMAARKRPLIDRFNKFVVRGDDCWGWRGCHNGVGYAYLRVEKQLRLATHVSLELSGLPRPSSDHHACHSCDNPICTNPSHLFWGTRSDNMRDCARKGRKAPTPLRTHCRKGHQLTVENTIMSVGSDGKTNRRCKICRRASSAMGAPFIGRIAA